MLQNKDKTEGNGLKACLDGPCSLKTEYEFPVYHVVSYLFPFAGCLVTQVSLMVPTMSLTLPHTSPYYSGELFKKVTTALFI